MSSKHEVVIAGAGHHGLTVACYLAKAGLDVILLERSSKVGGGVTSTEAAAPGFVTDTCAVVHHLFQASPIMTRDELGLQSKYGLKYSKPDLTTAVQFTDGTYLTICASLDRTCQSIAKFSQKDAEAYRNFASWISHAHDMMIAGFFAPPPPFGMYTTMLDSSDESRELLRCNLLSAWDVIEEWFSCDKVKIALSRWVSEIMIMPQTKGTGIVVPMMIGLQHSPGRGPGIPIGGSGKVSESMEQFILDNGGTIRTKAAVKEFIVKGGKCEGVILEDGEKIFGTKAVISNLNIKKMFPEMFSSGLSPEGYTRKVDRLRVSEFSAYQQGLALHEAPNYKEDELNEALLVEYAPANEEDYLRYFENLKHGVTDHFPGLVCQSRYDETRAPKGKHTLYLYEYAPYFLKDGGPSKWDEISDQYAEEVMNFLRQFTTNMGKENIIGHWKMSPLEMERKNPSFLYGDFGHVAAFLDQNMGNRPLPGWNYKTPFDNLFLCGPGCHPGAGCNGAGRAAAQAVMEELGIDIETVV